MREEKCKIASKLKLNWSSTKRLQSVLLVAETNGTIAAVDVFTDTQSQKSVSLQRLVKIVHTCAQCLFRVRTLQTLLCFSFKSCFTAASSGPVSVVPDPWSRPL